jgi:hypothetical protein
MGTLREGGALRANLGAEMVRTPSLDNWLTTMLACTFLGSATFLERKRFSFIAATSVLFYRSSKYSRTFELLYVRRALYVVVRVQAVDGDVVSSVRAFEEIKR